MCEFLSQLIRFLIAACIFGLVMSGCQDQQQNGPEPSDLDVNREFRIGIVPEQNIFRQRERYEPLARYLSMKLGLDIELRMLTTYGNIIEEIQTQELDGFFLGSFTGAVVMKRMGAEPLARPQNADGISTYRGLIFTRRDSGITTARDMKDKTFVFPDKATSAGWLFPLRYFKENDIDDPSSWLGEIFYSGTHEDAILDVINNRADIGAAKDTIFYRLTVSDNRIVDKLRILAISAPFPENTLLVSRGTDEALKAKLREALLTMHQNEEGLQALQKFGAVKFIETSAEDYAPVFEYSKDTGLNLSNYGAPNNLSAD
ncbi:MAG: phosphate/phosphite/phosphonate ABC transporter substrate-binding protein [Desulfurivibrionaceae bacterium]